jgi:thiol-disulfide isomerase/thioredoxin
MMKNRISIFLISLIFGASVSAQSITGNLSLLVNKPIKLEGFNGLKTYLISTSTIDEKGNFKLIYSKSDYGVGYLMSANEKPLFVILSGEDVEIVGEALSYTETIKITKEQENKLFEQYAKEHPLREQALSAWVYLEKIYTQDSLFAVQEHPIKNIQKEKLRIKAEDAAFLAKLPKESYVSWFLPTRKLVSSVSTVAQYRPEEIPSTIAAFRAMDYTDQRLYKSGLFKDAIESHFWLLENMGQPLDTVFKEMSISIDYLITNLLKNEKKFNEITKYLFELLERRSLLQASEYLAIKVLTQNGCTVNDNLAKQLESYRAMKIGNTAPDIVFSGKVLKNGLAIKTPNRLYDIQSDYKVVIFGASWCPKCGEELSQLLSVYQKWKSKGVEVVFVSLDTDKKVFNDFSSVFPFVSMCDYNKWNTQAAKDYYVFASPTMFLLDHKSEILLRPHSVKQVDAWVDWNLVQGNK